MSRPLSNYPPPAAPSMRVTNVLLGIAALGITACAYFLFRLASYFVGAQLPLP